MHGPGEILVSSTGALALGALAAALPALLGEPATDQPALRGLAVAAIFWLVAALLLAVTGWRSGARPYPGGEKTTAAGAARSVLRATVSPALPLAILALPALCTGIETGEVAALSALLQASWGWRTPLPFAALGGLSLAVLFFLCRLLGSLRLRSPRWLRLVPAGLVLMLVFAGVAAVRLLDLPAPAGWERATKGWALVLLAALCLAGTLAHPVGRRRRDLRAPILGAGSAAAGLVALGLALDYLTPSVHDLEDVTIEWDRGSWTLLDATLRDRPDLHGIFGLPPGATRLELVGVLPGYPLNGRSATPQWTSRGLAHLEMSDEESRVDGSLSPEWRPIGMQVTVRSRWFRWLDRPSPLTIANPLAWCVSPGLRFAVSFTSEPQLQADLRRDGASRKLMTPSPLPRSRIEISRRTWLGSRSEIVSRGLSSPAQVVWIDDRAVRFVVTSDSRIALGVPDPASGPSREAGGSTERSGRPVALSVASDRFPTRRPHYLGLATYLVNERQWVDQKWTASPVGQTVRLSFDRRFALAECGPFRMPPVPLCVFDLEADGTQIPSRTLSRRLPFPTRAIPLTGGAVAATWYEGGGRSRMHWFLSLFGADGQETRTVDLEEAAGVRFARELEDGSLAIARLPEGFQRYNAPTFGWRLEAYDPSTGGRRLLGADLGTCPLTPDDVSRVFLERSGRLVVPTAHGLVDARSGARSFRPTLDSTARQERIAP